MFFTELGADVQIFCRMSENLTYQLHNCKSQKVNKDSVIHSLKRINIWQTVPELLQLRVHSHKNTAFSLDKARKRM